MVWQISINLQLIVNQYKADLIIYTKPKKGKIT